MHQQHSFIKQYHMHISVHCIHQISDHRHIPDICSGQICAMIIKGPPKWFHLVGCDTEYVIDWKKIVRIGPDVILVDICAEKCLRKL